MVTSHHLLDTWKWQRFSPTQLPLLKPCSCIFKFWIHLHLILRYACIECRQTLICLCRVFERPLDDGFLRILIRNPIEPCTLLLLPLEEYLLEKDEWLFFFPTSKCNDKICQLHIKDRPIYKHLNVPMSTYIKISIVVSISLPMPQFHYLMLENTLKCSAWC